MKAFPSDRFEYDAHGNKQPMGRNEGMDLRDYFAAKALSGMAANPEEYGVWSSEQIANNCYEVADAMMEARNK